MKFEQLLAKVREGDREALGELLSHWRGVIRSERRHTLGADMAARADTSDVAQEAIIRTWRDLGQFRGTCEQQFAAWTRSIGDWQTSKQRRLHRRRKRSVAAEEAFPVQDALDGRTPDAEAACNEESSLVLAAVEQLDESMQFIILRRFVDDHSLRSIADELGSSYSSVRGLYARALRALRSALQAEGLDEMQSSSR